MLKLVVVYLGPELFVIANEIIGELRTPLLNLILVKNTTL